MSGSRYITALILAATLTGVGIGVALAASLTNVGSFPRIRGARIYSAREVYTFTATRLIRSRSATLESLPLLAHGGRTVIEWYCGGWSPARPRGSSDVSLYIDGVRTASAFLDGGGPFSVRPGILRWIGVLAAGSHLIEIRLEHVHGGVDLPLVVAPGRVPEGLTVDEYVLK